MRTVYTAVIHIRARIGVNPCLCYLIVRFIRYLYYIIVVLHQGFRVACRHRSRRKSISPVTTLNVNLTEANMSVSAFTPLWIKGISGYMPQARTDKFLKKMLGCCSGQILDGRVLQQPSLTAETESQGH